MYRIIINYTADGEYIVKLKQCFLWFLWITISADMAFDSNFFKKDLIKQIKKWVKLYGKNVTITNNTDLDLSGVMPSESAGDVEKYSQP